MGLVRGANEFVRSVRCGVVIIPSSTADSVTILFRGLVECILATTYLRELDCIPLLVCLLRRVLPDGVLYFCSGLWGH
jgi:hypothetical protein